MFTNFIWFWLLGDVRSYCENGAWSFSEMPICVKPGCPDLTVPENGYSISSYSGSVREFFCFTGSSDNGSRGRSGVNSQSFLFWLFQKALKMFFVLICKTVKLWYIYYKWLFELFPDFGQRSEQGLVVYCDGFHWNGTAPACEPRITTEATTTVTSFILNMIRVVHKWRHNFRGSMILWRQH